MREGAFGHICWSWLTLFLISLSHFLHDACHLLFILLKYVQIYIVSDVIKSTILHSYEIFPKNDRTVCMLPFYSFVFWRKCREYTRLSATVILFCLYTHSGPNILPMSETYRYISISTDFSFSKLFIYL